MKNTRLLLLLLVFLLNSGCASFGPTVVVDTPEPAEDIVVRCLKEKSYFIGHNASGYVTTGKVFVTKSGEEVDCGLLFGGKAAGVDVMHPIYMGAGIGSNTNPDESDQLELIDGVLHIKLTKTKLDILDELKAEFEAGKWDRARNPGRSYLGSMPGCGFPHQYFDYYSKVMNVHKEHFRNNYSDQMLACFRRTFAITKKYDPQIGKQLPSPEVWMDRLWGSDDWSKWNASK